MLPAIEIYKMLLDGSQWGYWNSFALPTQKPCLLTWTPIGTAMHWRPGTWLAETHNLAFFWPDRWYVLHVKYDLEGQFAGCYCDIVMPNPQVDAEARIISYTDLYVDVVITAEKHVSTKDEAVYDRAMQVIPRLIPLHDRAFAELDALADQARAWTGPFRYIPAQLVRTDWEQCDPASSTFARSIVEQWGAMPWED